LKNNAPTPKPIMHTPEQSPFFFGMCSMQFFNGATYPYPINTPKKKPYMSVYKPKELTNETANTDPATPNKEMSAVILLLKVKNLNLGRTIPILTLRTEIVTMI
jgi:hypothetical protein